MEDEEMGALIRKTVRNMQSGGEKINPVKPFTNTRSVYDTILAEAVKKGKKPPTPGYLRMEASLNTTTGNIAFQVKENQGNPNVTERRLKLADRFIALQWGLFLGRVTMAGAAPTQTEFSKQIKYTYPESKVFTAAGEAANLQNVYNGYISLRIGGNIIIDSFPNYKFYRVPDSQKGMQYATTAAGVTQQDGGWPNPDWGFLSLTPSINLSGSQTIELNCNMPQSINMAAAAGSYNNLIFELYGFLLQDGASYNV